MNDRKPVKSIGSFCASLRVPGSKSLTNRALLLAALADGESLLRRPLAADDTHCMADALVALGFGISPAGLDQDTHVVGKRGRIQRAANLMLANAGTAYRFLTAACCLSRHSCVLDGTPRMRKRPVGQLVDALHRIGGHIDYLQAQGYPPVRVCGTGLRGGDLEMPTTISSQYISALLLVGPYCERGLTIRFNGPVTSRPYVQMTVDLMRQFGVEAQIRPPLAAIRVEPGWYRATDYTVEADASNASYFLAAAAIIPGSQCTIEGLGADSLQGDLAFADVLGRMGANVRRGLDSITVRSPSSGQDLHGVDVELNAMPDMVQTLAAVALFATGPTMIRNIGNLRVKETDRLAALRQELTKLGAVARIDRNDLFVAPPADGRIRPATIQTYEDHRMAMSFSIVGLRSRGITIEDPACVNKTFPKFFEYLERLGTNS